MLPEMTLVEARETTPRHYGVGLTAGRTVAVMTLTTLRNMAATGLHFASPVTVDEGIASPASVSKPCLPVSWHTAPQ
jgi:hypothetical protein